MNRRTFFAAIGAAIAGAKAKVWKPTAAPSLDLDAFGKMYIDPAMKAFANEMDNDLTTGLGYFKIGNTIEVRRPPRFRADGYDNWRDSGARCKEFGLEPGEMLHLMRERFRSASEITKAYDAQVRADFELICGPVPVKVYAEPSGDIPLASSCECEEYEEWDD